ncbi:MAG: homoserine O-acetyltransferase [Anaerolineae bacterium]
MSNPAPAPTDPLSTRRIGAVGVVSTQTFDLPAPLVLESGAVLSPVRIAYETYGALSPTRDNVILVCHALSGDAHAAGWSADLDTPTALDGIAAEERGVVAKGGLGWWDGMIGPGKAFDTTKFFIVASNIIGGCRGSTGPSSANPATGRPYGPDFPVVTVADMVAAQRALLDHLGIETLFAISGGSLGGMQAMEWAVRWPHAVKTCIPIASTAHLGAQGVAWNAIARNAIMADPAWQGGHYYGTGRLPTAGIGVARMVGHVTYLSAESMAEKFGRRWQDREGPSYALTSADFAVESYLRHQAEKFARRFDANSYLYISRALTYFDLARSHGFGSLEHALSRAYARFLLISFSSDWLYPPADSEAIARALRINGRHVEHHNLDTSYGHDSFLLEEARQIPIIRDFLDRAYVAVQAGQL